MSSTKVRNQASGFLYSLVFIYYQNDCVLEYCNTECVDLDRIQALGLISRTVLLSHRTSWNTLIECSYISVKP